MRRSVSGGVDVELSLDQTHFSHDTAAILEDGRLTFAKGVHDLESLDRRIRRLQSLESTHWLDQLFQLAVISFDHVVEMFDLPMQRLLRQLAFLLEVRDRRTKGRALYRC